MEKGKKPIQEEEENGFSSLKNYQSNVASSSSELPLKFETAFEQSGKLTKTQSLLGFCKKKKKIRKLIQTIVFMIWIGF